MSERIPQSTTIRVPFKAYSSTDGGTEATGITITITISKNGAAFGNPSAGATNATEISNGWYYVDLSTTDTGTLGPLIIRGTGTGIDDVGLARDVVKATTGGFTALPDVAAGASGGVPLSVDSSGRVDVLKINGTSQTARDLGASVLLSSGTGTGQISLSSGAVALQADQAVNVTKVGGTSQTAKDLGASVTQTGDAYARLGAPAGASVSADVAAVKSDTGSIKIQTDKLTFTVANQIDANVLDWKSATAPAMTGDAYARIGAAGAGLTALGDTRIAHLDADVSSRMATFTLPTNFSSLGIGASGHITNVDTLTTYTGNTPQTGDAYARIGAPAGASVSADVAAVKSDSAAIKIQSDKLTFTVTNQIDSNVLDWKSATAPAMTGDAYARIGAAGAGLTAVGDTRLAYLDADVSSRLATSGYTAPDNGDIAAIKFKTDSLPSSPADESLIIAATNALATSIAALPTAAGIRSAVGLATANLDTQLSTITSDVSGLAPPDNASIAAIKAKTDNLPAQPVAVADVPTANQNADALLDRVNGVETGWSLRATLRIIFSVLAGRSSGLEGLSVAFRDVNNTVTRVSATVDANGDRTQLTLDAS
jgi:hypothetical protein